MALARLSFFSTLSGRGFIRGRSRPRKIARNHAGATRRREGRPMPIPLEQIQLHGGSHSAMNAAAEHATRRSSPRCATSVGTSVSALICVPSTGRVGVAW
jgi:hypothetical protein